MENIIKLIEDINQEIYNATEENSLVEQFIQETPPLEFSTIGYAHHVSFFGITIWCSENDERPMINENTPYEDYIPLGSWLRQEIKRILNLMSKFDKCLEGKLV
jgi:hypothetical protein